MPHNFITLPRQAKDITGQRFNRLVALGPVSQNARKNIIWLCRCDCGNEITTRYARLRSGHTKSCGCLQKEKVATLKLSHGMAATKEYSAWKSMIKRCHNQRDTAYENYGGRGIFVCKEWRDDFVSFHNHIGPIPFKGATVDRISNNGNYEPGNVRWATHQEQANNKRNNRLVEFRGERLTFPEWSRRIGIPSSTLVVRVDRLGWAIERAFTTPPRKRAT